MGQEIGARGERRGCWVSGSRKELGKGWWGGEVSVAA